MTGKRTWVAVCLFALIFQGCSSGPEGGGDGGTTIVRKPSGQSARAAGIDVPAELGGPGFAGEGWETATPTPSQNPNAPKGGKIIMGGLIEFPSTLRTIGKDANNQFRTSALNTLVYENLLTLEDATLDIVPLLATHWKISEDKMTFWFRLDPEARWADGHPVTADDVIATWRLMVDEGILMPYTNVLYGKFEEPVAESPYILRVTTKEENWRHFLYFAISMQIMPAHIIGGMSGTEYMETFQFTVVPGSGPYEVRPEDIDQPRSITLRRRPDWWGLSKPWNAGSYNFDEIEWVIIMDDRLRLEKMKAGELDAYLVGRASWWVNEFDFDDVKRGIVQKRKIWNERVLGIAGLGMNMRKPPFDDIRVRRAMSHLYDRDKLIEKLFHGEYMKLKSYFPGGPYENLSHVAYGYDQQKAVDLLAEAGWRERNEDGWLVNEKGRIFELTMSFDSPSWERIHTVLQEDLATVGIKLNLKQVTSATQFKSNMDHEFTITFQSWSGLFWPNPNSSFHSDQADAVPSTNITGVKNEKIDELALIYDHEYDQDRRIELIRQIDSILYEEEVAYALAWYAPFVRIVFWNKFGYPDGALGRSGDYFAIPALWWYDAEKDKAMQEAIKDRKKKLPVGATNDVYWLEKLGKEVPEQLKGSTSRIQ